MPGLLGRARLRWDPTVRIASLLALAKIGASPGGDIAPIVAGIVKGMSDEDPTVRIAAVEAAGTLSPAAGSFRGTLCNTVKKCVADPNQKVADEATKVLVTSFGFD